ncbi:MAG: hypothetical protein ACI8SR_001224 [Oceanicoccus sp.]|jgi:hypothetical protein
MYHLIIHSQVRVRTFLIVTAFVRGCTAPKSSNNTYRSRLLFTRRCEFVHFSSSLHLYEGALRPNHLITHTVRDYFSLAGASSYIFHHHCICTRVHYARFTNNTDHSRLLFTRRCKFVHFLSSLHLYEGALCPNQTNTKQANLYSKAPVSFE